MANITIGRVAPLFKGDWNNKTTYEYLDVVYYEGSSYVLIVDSCTNVIPTTDKTMWQLVAYKGTATEDKYLIENVYYNQLDTIGSDSNYTHSLNHACMFKVLGGGNNVIGVLTQYSDYSYTVTQILQTNATNPNVSYESHHTNKIYTWHRFYNISSSPLHGVAKGQFSDWQLAYSSDTALKLEEISNIIDGIDFNNLVTNEEFEKVKTQVNNNKNTLSKTDKLLTETVEQVLSNKDEIEKLQKSKVGFVYPVNKGEIGHGTATITNGILNLEGGDGIKVDYYEKGNSYPITFEIDKEVVATQENLDEVKKQTIDKLSVRETNNGELVKQVTLEGGLYGSTLNFQNHFNINQSKNGYNNITDISLDTDVIATKEDVNEVSDLFNKAFVVSDDGGVALNSGSAEATPIGSFAHGMAVKALGGSSHAEGQMTEATASFSHAEGLSTKVNAPQGNWGHAEGCSTEVNAPYGHTEGIQTQANATAGHAEGLKTITEGKYSHAEGTETKAIGESSHAEGYLTQAEGQYSHAEGIGTKTEYEGEHASGLYNIPYNGIGEYTLFTVGNGYDEDNRHNAFEVLNTGKVNISDYYDRNSKIHNKPMICLQDKLNEIEPILIQGYYNPDEITEWGEDINKYQTPPPILMKGGSLYKEFTKEDIDKYREDVDEELTGKNNYPIYSLSISDGQVDVNFNNIYITFEDRKMEFFSGRPFSSTMLENLISHKTYICENPEDISNNDSKGSTFAFNFKPIDTDLDFYYKDHEITEGGVYRLIIRGYDEVGKYDDVDKDDYEQGYSPIVIYFGVNGVCYDDLFIRKVTGESTGYKHWNYDEDVKGTNGYVAGKFYKVLSDNSLYYGDYYRFYKVDVQEELDKKADKDKVLDKFSLWNNPNFPQYTTDAGFKNIFAQDGISLTYKEDGNKGLVIGAPGLATKDDLNNVSATKLKTPISLWGQQFDGSQSIKGNITVETPASSGYNINMTLMSPNSSHSGFNFGESRTNNNAGGIYHYQKSKSSEKNGIEFTGWGTSILMFVEYDGLVGIGTTSPTEKLDVVGNIKASGEIISPTIDKLEDKIDDAWKELFIKLWDSACKENNPACVYGKYNRETGYFELNGITDIDWDEAIEIYKYKGSVFGSGLPCMQGSKCRTNLLLNPYAIGNAISIGRSNAAMAFSSNQLEVVRLGKEGRWTSLENESVSLFYGSPNIKRIIGDLAIAGITNENVFSSEDKVFSKLEEISLVNLNNSLTRILKNSPFLSFNSLQTLVTKAINKTPINVVIHNDVYAKLNDESNTEWYELNELAKEKQISFLTSEMYAATPATMELKDEVEVINDDVNSKIMELEKQIQELKNIMQTEK